MSEPTERRYWFRPLPSESFIETQTERQQECRQAKLYAVDELKDATVIMQYQLKSNNRFQQMQQSPDIEDQWIMYKQIVTEYAEDVIGWR